MNGAGIIFGLSTAVLQSFAYIFSRAFLARRGTSPALLFALSHVQMGLISLVLLPFVLTAVPSVHVVLPLIATSVCYLFGQWMLFRVLRTVESSKLTPLLGFKVPLLAVATSVFLGAELHPIAWIAVMLCTAGGLLISPPQGGPNRRLLAAAALICIGYAGSDLSIPFLVNALSGAARVPVAAAVALCYLSAGIFGTLFTVVGAAGPRKRLFDVRLHRDALPYSLAWIMAMASLFASFSMIGVVFGNMLQSTRALLSVLLGAAVTRLGLLSIENIRSRTVFVSRMIGAVIITGAIMIYFYIQRR